MNKETILSKMTSIIQQPYLIFNQRFIGKTNNTLVALRLLNEENQVTAGRIAEYLDIKPSSATQIIKKLESAGTAIRIKSETDARVTYVEITDHGRDVISEGGDASEELVDEIFKGFSPEDLGELERYLDRISDNLSSDDFTESLEQLFGNDSRWQRFEKMSSQFGRAREQMMDQQFRGTGQRDFSQSDRRFDFRTKRENNQF